MAEDVFNNRSPISDLSLAQEREKVSRHDKQQLQQKEREREKKKRQKKIV